jgi:tetratricopeptide (TPR) repeat protein
MSRCNEDGVRLTRLEEARRLAIECRYDEALEAIDGLCREFPDDIEILRLNGNVLEQRALDEMEYSASKLTRSSDYMSARGCYEQILDLDSENTIALIDLGDHYKNLEAFDRAFTYYEQALRLLRAGKFRIGRSVELEELERVFDDLLREKSTADRAMKLKIACRELNDDSGTLDSFDARKEE